MVKSLSVMQETQVWSLDQEDLLEKEVATCSSILAWRIPWTEEPGDPQSMGSQRIGHDWETSTSLHFMVLLVVMYECESWTIQKAEHWRTDAFEQWCWRRLLRVLWTTRRSNQSFLKEINSEYSLEGLVLKVKLQYFGHPIERANSLEKTLMLGKIEDKRRGGWQRMRWLNGNTESMDMRLSNLWEIVKDREVWCVAVNGGTKSRTQPSDWKTTHI